VGADHVVVGLPPPGWRRSDAIWLRRVAASWNGQHPRARQGPGSPTPPRARGRRVARRTVIGRRMLPPGSYGAEWADSGGAARQAVMSWVAPQAADRGRAWDSR